MAKYKKIDQKDIEFLKSIFSKDDCFFGDEIGEDYREMGNEDNRIK